jgi:hypothetical protein
MATKALRRFVQRVDYYGADLELCDALVRSFMGSANSTSTVAEGLASTNTQYPYLAKRVNSKRSREICGMHLKRTVHIAFVKDLFEDFSEYISTAMTKAAQAGIDPNKFVGEVKLDLHVADILKSGNWDAAVKLISDAVFRKLENERNTRELIRKATVRLGLNLTQAKIVAAMPYLDARHILVHRDGKTDEQYRTDYPGIALRGDAIVVDYTFVSAAKTNIIALAQHVDDNLIAANLVRAQDLSGNA